MSKNKRNEDYDFLDDLFDRHMNDDQFINSSVNDFGRMVRDSINEEARKNGYDSLSDMIQGEIQSGLQGTKKTPKSRAARAVRRRKTHYKSRFDYFMEVVQDRSYSDRYRGYYRDGHLEAIQRYINQVELNRNNLCAVEKIVNEEIRYFYSKNNKRDKYSEGYYDGLKFVQRCLLQSKCVMMEEVSDALSEAMSSL